jgi:hypothetical protein
VCARFFLAQTKLEKQKNMIVQIREYVMLIDQNKGGGITGVLSNGGKTRLHQLKS